MTDQLPETHDGTIKPSNPALGHYEGQPVVAAGVTIANASGGLHDAVAVDPVKLDIGSTVYVVLECEVRPPQYDPVDKDNLRGSLRLVNRLRAKEATFVDGDLVGEHLEAQRLRIEQAEAIADQRAREEAGELPLPYDEEGEPMTAAQVLDDALDLAEVDA